MIINISIVVVAMETGPTGGSLDCGIWQRLTLCEQICKFWYFCSESERSRDPIKTLITGQIYYSFFPHIYLAMFQARTINAEHKDLIHDVAYDFYGRRMATCSSDQSVKVIV